MTVDRDRTVGGPPLLPLAGAPTAAALGTPVAACSLDDDGCITCGDVAVPLTVVEAGDDALCRDQTGREEVVATELVGPVEVGDLLLVHAKVALEKLNPEEVEIDALR